MRRHFTGTATLAGAHLHAGWRGLGTWAALMAGLVVATGWGITALYPTAADRAAYAATAGVSPAVAAVNGRGYELTELGGITAYEVGFMALMAFPVIAIHLAIRLTRHEEDAGRTELVTSGRVGRLAPLAAAAITLAATLTVFVVATTLGLQIVGLPRTGSWLYALGLAAFAGAHAAIGLLAAEVSREARTAYGLGLLAVLITFLGRAIVDGRGLAASWISPSGWLAELRPWGPGNWWPLAAYAGLTACGGLLSAATALRRDLGGGLVATRPGPASGGARLGTPAGLAWRLTRTPLLAWLFGIAAWSAALGTLGGEMARIVEENPAIQAAFPVQRPEDLVTSLAVLLCGIGAAAFAVQASTRLAREESAGRLGVVLATRTSRRRLWLTWCAVAAGGSVLVLMVSALTLGATTAWATGEPANLPTALGAGLALVPPVVLIAAVAAALQAAAPVLARFGWALLGWATVVGMLAEPLRLPTWARDLSPLHAVGRVPIEDPRPAALAGMAVIVAVLAATGLARFSRRDLTAG